jgi:ribosomal protein S18 acetylase RimI-like enzyme
MEPGAVRVERAKDAAAVMAAGDLFDHAPLLDATTRFLAEPGHHLLLAFEGRTAVGMISGVEMTHPDKGTEMFLYELGVEERAQRRGVGRALVAALAELARKRGCYGMWVLTDLDNHAALHTYQAAGAVREPHQAYFTWSFGSCP